MRTRKMMLEGYAGFGGQSEAYLRAGWDVLRIDNNPLLSDVQNMVIMDLRAAEPFNLGGGSIEYAHFSPPCTEFSLGFNAPRSKAIRSGKGDEYEPDMTDVLNSIRIKDALKPRFWSLENVRGSIKYIEPILGPPRLIVGPFVYWGNFPLFDPSGIVVPSKTNLKMSSANPLRPNYRAHIPLPVSEGFHAAMTAQASMLDF